MDEKPRIVAVPSRAAALAAWEELHKESRLFGMGEVRLAVLSLLQAGPNHGYGIMKELRRRLPGGYKASAGSVYPTLKQLEHEALVECRAEGGKKIFTLTAAGRRELKANPETYRQVWRRIARAAATAAAAADEAGDASFATGDTSPATGQPGTGHLSHATGDIPIALQGLLRAAYGAAAASAGRPAHEATLRAVLWQFAARLEVMFDLEDRAGRAAGQ